MEAIRNSIRSRNNDEIYAATVLAALQRPKFEKGLKKVDVEDAPEVYTDRHGNKRVRWLKDASGKNLNPKIMHKKVLRDM